MVPLVGTPAPAFETDAIRDGERVRISSSDFPDRWIYLFFFPEAFTFVCPTEVSALSDSAEKFRQLETEVLCCSMDPIDVHEKWIAAPRSKRGLGGKLNVPLLADPDRKIAEAYGVVPHEGARSARSSFIIDPKGKVRHVTLYDPSIGQSIAEVLRMLVALRHCYHTGHMCPVNWLQDDPSIDPKRAEEYFEPDED